MRHRILVWIKRQKIGLWDVECLQWSNHWLPCSCQRWLIRSPTYPRAVRSCALRPGQRLHGCQRLPQKTLHQEGTSTWGHSTHQGRSPAALSPSRLPNWVCLGSVYLRCSVPPGSCQLGLESVRQGGCLGLGAGVDNKTYGAGFPPPLGEVWLQEVAHCSLQM